MERPPSMYSKSIPSRRPTHRLSGALLAHWSEENEQPRLPRAVMSADLDQAFVSSRLPSEQLSPGPTFTRAMTAIQLPSKKLTTANHRLSPPSDNNSIGRMYRVSDILTDASSASTSESSSSDEEVTRSPSFSHNDMSGFTEISLAEMKDPQKRKEKKKPSDFKMFGSKKKEDSQHEVSSVTSRKDSEPGSSTSPMMEDIVNKVADALADKYSNFREEWQGQTKTLKKKNVRNMVKQLSVNNMVISSSKPRARIASKQPRTRTESDPEADTNQPISEPYQKNSLPQLQRRSLSLTHHNRSPSPPRYSNLPPPPLPPDSIVPIVASPRAPPPPPPETKKSPWNFLIPSCMRPQRIRSVQFQANQTPDGSLVGINWSQSCCV